MLVPEYLVVVLLVGAFRGWLFPIGSTLGTGVAVVLLAAVVGTLGALLITLPAVSLPGIAMVDRALDWRTTALTTWMAVVGGLLGAGGLAVL